MAQRRVLTRQEESALVGEARARECATLAAGTPDQMAEWFAPEQPGQMVLLPLAISPRRARQVSAQQARAAPAVFVQAGPRERLASVVAKREKALAASPSFAAAQVASLGRGTTSARAGLRKSESPRVSLERAFLLLEEPREWRVAGQVHPRLAQPRGQRQRVGV